MKNLFGLVLLVFASAAISEDDIGILNEHALEPGILFGGQPTAEQLVALERSSGFRTVIDLRGPDEERGIDEAAIVAETGMRYMSLPVTADTLTQSSTFERFFEIFEDAEQPVFIHCASGNRVGALYYAWLVAQNGTPRDEALAQAQASGLRNLALVEPVERFLDARQSTLD